MRLRGAVLHRNHVARLHRGRPGGRAARVPRAPAAVRRAAGGGRRMSAPSQQTRLGLEVLTVSAALGTGAAPRFPATPGGLTPFLATFGGGPAAGWILAPTQTAGSGDAPCLGRPPCCLAP